MSFLIVSESPEKFRNSETKWLINETDLTCSYDVKDNV